MKKNFVFSTLATGVFLLGACEAENLAPVAHAGPDLGVVPPENKTELKGSGTDEDGTIVRYEWTLVRGPAGSTLVAPAAATTLVEGLVDGVYVFELKVTDNDDLTGTDQVSVFVGDPCAGCWDY